jgi:hypothetical protein
MQSVVSTHTRVIFTRICVNMTPTSVITTFLHAECNFHTHCDFDMHEYDHDTQDCDFNMHLSDFYTQSWFLTHMSVIMTHSRMITTQTSVTYTRTS